jgi:hypothetical protein
MGITDVELLEQMVSTQERLRGRARHLPYGELDRKIMHETADLLESLKHYLEPKSKPKKKNVKS